MADLTGLEKQRFEQLFGMRSGYVLDFTNRTFQSFVLDETGIDLYDGRFAVEGTSKACRLRVFWKVESNHTTAKLLKALLEYYRTTTAIHQEILNESQKALFDICSTIPARLLQGSGSENLDAIRPNSADKDFSLLAEQIKDSISRDEPETALDRLHTFLMKFLRELCGRHGIAVEKSKPLHSYLGEYVRIMKDKGLLESEMSERILKSSISILDSFNAVRNDKSLAHDNPILNRSESRLIFDHIAATIRFLEALEVAPNEAKEEP